MLSVYHDHCYCLGVPRGKEGSSVEVIGAAFDSNPATGVPVPMTHRDFQGWLFIVTLTASGSPAGFTMRPHPPMPAKAPRTLREDESRTAAIPDDAPPITARLLRRVPLGELQAAAESWYRRQVVPHVERTVSRARARPAGKASGFRADLEAWSSALDTRPGRQGRPDREYAAVSAMYVAALGTGTEVRDLAAQLGYSTSQIRNSLYAARRRGLLTASPRGRAGGHLTEKAQRLLTEEDLTHGQHRQAP